MMQANKQTLTKRGFALVATILLMVLLVIISVGLLSLSTVTMRSSSQDMAQLQAQANARMALMIAIGQLQSTMGPDKRISARAATMAQHPALNASVDPISAKAWWVGVASSDTSESIGTGSKSVVWLVSGLNSQASAANQISSPQPFLDREIALYGANSLNLTLTGGEEITAGLVPISDRSAGAITGSYAYFVDDNGMKAQLAASHAELANVPVSGEVGTVIPGSYDLSILDGMGGMSGVPVQDYLKLNSINDLPLIGNNTLQISRDKRMSYTSRSLGVLSDVKHGGLKKDLTIAFEKSTTSSVSKSVKCYSGARTVTSTYPNMPSYPVFDEAFPKNSDSDWGKYLLLDESKRSEFAEQGYIHWAMLRDYYNLKRYIRNEGGYDCLAPMTIDGNMSTLGPNSQPGKMYSKGLIPPHRIGLASTLFSPHEGLPYGDYGVRPNDDGAVSEEYLEYTKHSPIVPVLGELQYNIWLEKVPARPMSGTVPKKPTTTQALRTNTQVWVSQYNPYNIRMRFAGVKQTKAFRVNNLLQATIRVPNSIKVDGFYGNSDGMSGSLLTLNALQDQYDRRSYTVDGAEYLGAGRAMMAAFEQDYEMVNANGTGMVYGTNVRNLVTEKLSRDYNIDDVAGPLPPSLTWGVQFGDTGLMSHGVGDKGNQIGSFFASQFLWEILPTDSTGKQATFDNLGPSLYNDNSRLCYGVRLRTTKESGSSIRPLVDANIRGFFLNPRWDTPLGVGSSLASYTTVNSESDTSLDRVPQMSTQSSGKGYTYWGGEHGPFQGHDRVILFDVPRKDLVSLGQLQHANVGKFSYEPSYVIGNSYANLRIPLDKWKVMTTDTSSAWANISGSYALYDASYLTNEALWDGYIFTTIPQVADNYNDPNQPTLNADYFAKLLDREELLSNPRFIPYQPKGSSFNIATLQAESAVNYNAGHILVDGAFNVNSTSVDAWEAFLSGTYGLPYQKVDDKGTLTGFATPSGEKIRFPRVQSVYGEDMTTDSPDENYWVGFRSLEQSEVRELAQEIVNQVIARGPFLSMGEFVNRKLETGELGEKGALQAALDKTINKQPLSDFDQAATNPAMPKDSNQAAGFPGQLLQGDILQALSPCMTVRSDTFTVRAYGESLNPKNGKVLAQAWCEAVVQRYPDPISSSGSQTALEELAEPSSMFGREFRVTGFRWLNPKEI